MYHLSAPSTSRNPSLLESLPRRRLDDELGMGMPAPGLLLPATLLLPAGEARGEWIATLEWDCCCAVFGDARAADEGFDDADACVVCAWECECECLFGCGCCVEAGMEGPWGRKAARKLERKYGRCDGMVRVCV